MNHDTTARETMQPTIDEMEGRILQLTKELDEAYEAIRHADKLLHGWCRTAWNKIPAVAAAKAEAEE